MNAFRAHEVLLDLESGSTADSGYGYFGIVFTQAGIDEVLECVRSFQKTRSEVSTLQVQVHECPWHGGFYRGSKEDHDPSGSRLDVQEMLVGEFFDTRVAFEVDVAGNLISVPDERSYIGVQWRAYDPASRSHLDSRPLSPVVLRGLDKLLDNNQNS